MTRAPVAALGGLLLLAGCFSPSLGGAFLCGPEGQEPRCPDGYPCVDGVCGGEPASGADAARPPPDGRGAADARLADARLADARVFPDARPLPDGATCAAGTFVQCQTEELALVCDGSGGYQGEPCAYRCNQDALRCEQCDPARSKQCDGDALVTCSSRGEIVSSVTCAGFCQPTASDTARCATLVPTNLPQDLCDAPALRPRRITADIDIDTDLCSDGRKIDQPIFGQPICLLEYTDFVVEAGVLVRAVGSLPLAIAADTMTIGGTIDASAEGATPGAGAVALGAGGTSDGAFGNAGGGAGKATAGARGGTEDNLVYVAGGGAWGSADLEPLLGGGPGGRAGSSPQLCTVNCPVIAEGGGGGGALQLVACKSLSFAILSRVTAVGGGGRGGFQAFGTTLSAAGGGGGGGAGGAILIESPRVDVGIAAFFAATGGGGGGGGGLEEGTRGGPGEDGQPDRAAYGGSRGSPYAGRGGAGGILDADDVYGTPPVDGEPTQKPKYGAGGGGGAAGRIRFNTAPSSPIDPRTFIALPYPSTGAIKGH